MTRLALLFDAELYRLEFTRCKVHTLAQRLSNLAAQLNYSDALAISERGST